jgi:hypothetical protein
MVVTFAYNPLIGARVLEFDFRQVMSLANYSLTRKVFSMKLTVCETFGMSAGRGTGGLWYDLNQGYKCVLS